MAPETRRGTFLRAAMVKIHCLLAAESDYPLLQGSEDPKIVRFSLADFSPS